MRPGQNAIAARPLMVGYMSAIFDSQLKYCLTAREVFLYVTRSKVLADGSILITVNANTKL